MAEYTSTVNVTKQPAKETRRSEVSNKDVNASVKQNTNSSNCLATAVQQQLSKDYSKK